MFLRIAAILLFTSTAAVSGVIESVYTDLDSQTNCSWVVVEGLTEDEAGMGGAAVCEGLDDYPVYMTEGDARMFMAYGSVDDNMAYPGGFSSFSYVNDVLEWRLEDGKPYATILRWFISIEGDAGEHSESEILVVSTVADPALDPVDRVSCQVAYVDGLLNPMANLLARQAAHLAAKNFRCGIDLPIFVGATGPQTTGWSNQPLRFDGE